MSTQDASGIEFGIIPEESRQHFRLLELPPDLLSVIISENPPVLQLKSPEGPPGRELESTAVLCTLDKTYNVRQVSTSNEVYLTHTISNSDALSPQSRLEAITKFDSTLEVQAAKNVSAAPYIKAALPVYTTTGHYESKPPLTKAELFANIPLSDVECVQAYQDLACFEIQEGDGVRSLMPSSATKLKTWEAVLISASVSATDLTEEINSSELSRMANEHNDWPTEMITAILKSMCVKAVGGFVHLDEAKCARVVGETFLQVTTENGQRSMMLQTFLKAWADLLPEKWRGWAEVSLLEGSYILEDGGKEISFLESSGANGSDAAAGAVTETKSTLGAKRKWHEKFRASKKTS